MNLKGFFVATLESALEHGIATPDDVVKHATAEVLSIHLPRPLWARLLTACLGAPRVDAGLVVDTVGIANLCEHVPAPILWACIHELGARSLGSAAPPTRASAPAVERPSAAIMAAPPPVNVQTQTAITPAPPPPGPSIPSFGGATSTTIASMPVAPDATPAPSRARTPTGQRFRQSSTGTGIGRLAAPAAPTARRPQAAAEPPPPPPMTARRGQTESEQSFDVETEVGRDDWKSALAVDVDDEQLVDWTTSEDTRDPRSDDAPRKR